MNMNVDLSANANTQYTPNLHQVNQLLNKHIVGEEQTRMAVFTNWLLACQNVNMAGQRSSGKTWIADNVAKLLPKKGGLYVLSAGSNKSGYYQAEELKQHSHVIVPELNKLNVETREMLKDWGEGKPSRYKVTVFEPGMGGKRATEEFVVPQRPFIFCLADEDEAKIDPQLRSRLTVIRTDISEEQNKKVVLDQAQEALRVFKKEKVIGPEDDGDMRHHIATLPPWKPEQYIHPCAEEFINSIPTIFTDCRRDFKKYLNNTFGITRFYWKERMSVEVEGQKYFLVTPEDMYYNHIIYGRTLMESSLKCTSTERQLINILDETATEYGISAETLQAKVRNIGLNMSVNAIKKHMDVLSDLGYVEKVLHGRETFFRVGSLFKDFQFEPDWKRVFEVCEENVKKYFPSISEAYVEKYITNFKATNPFTGESQTATDLFRNSVVHNAVKSQIKPDGTLHSFGVEKKPNKYEYLLDQLELEKQGKLKDEKDLGVTEEYLGENL